MHSRSLIIAILYLLHIPSVLSQTCGSAASFDPKANICCNGNVQNYIAGPATACCGSVSYNPSASVCCPDNVTLLPMTSDPTMTSCCGSSLYNSGKQTCCNGVVQPLMGTAANTGCCGTTSYNLNSQSCSRGKLASK